MRYRPFGVPVEDLDDERYFCCECERQITEEAFFADERGGHFCETCVEEYVTELEAEAEKFANENCRINGPLPDYDVYDEFACTPEEYEEGNKESNTPNAYFTKCRHEYTNYDDLIKDLPKESSSIADQVRFDEIQRRITRILIDEIEENQPDACCDWFNSVPPEGY